MGGSTFMTREHGTTAQDAFNIAVRRAQHEHGHGGYTGTIAEKTTFIMFTLPVGHTPEAYARELLANEDPRIDDKWGPAGCIKIPETSEYLFFGWASA